MQVTPSIFKAYDIRGLVPSTLNEQVAEGLGKAFGTVALAEGQTTVAVGRDGRLSGPSLSAALIRGLVAAGIRVIDIGTATTPMLYFAANTACQSGIQVTGSHNPKDYNGFKMVLAGRAIYGEDIQALRQMIETETWQLKAGGSVSHLDVLADYTQRIVGDIRLARPMKIVVDSGNGIAGASAPGIFRALGCEVIELFSEVDGEFPNHHPDPSKPENLQDLMNALKTTGAELGLAFDGDGDRLGIVTQDGNNIYPDRQMQLFAQDVLSRVPGGTILFDVKCSQRLAPAIEAAGGQAPADGQSQGDGTEPPPATTLHEAAKRSDAAIADSLEEINRREQQEGADVLDQVGDKPVDNVVPMSQSQKADAARSKAGLN